MGWRHQALRSTNACDVRMMRGTSFLVRHQTADAENREGIQTTKRRGTEKTEDSYVVAYDVEPYHQGTRHYWTICRSQRPDELVSWGYEPTRELAEIAANRELEDLVAGRTQGGQVASSVKAYKHRIASRNY
jgi:hypothetical protein